jgi:hypothetical protein
MRQIFQHDVGVHSAEVVVSQHASATIAVPLPEGNAGFIRCCRFQRYPAYSSRAHSTFGLAQQGCPYARPPVFLNDIQRDDVSLCPFRFRD